MPSAPARWPRGWCVRACKWRAAICCFASMKRDPFGLPAPVISPGRQRYCCDSSRRSAHFRFETELDRHLFAGFTVFERAVTLQPEPEDCAAAARATVYWCFQLSHNFENCPFSKVDDLSGIGIVIVFKSSYVYPDGYFDFSH